MRRRRLTALASLAGVLACVWALPPLVAAVSPEEPVALSTAGEQGPGRGGGEPGSVDVAQAEAAGGDGSPSDGLPRLTAPIPDATGAQWLLVPEAGDVPGVDADEVVGVLRTAAGSEDVADLRFLLARSAGVAGRSGATGPGLVWVVLDGTAASSNAGAVLALYDAVTGAPVPIRDRVTVAVATEGATPSASAVTPPTARGVATPAGPGAPTRSPGAAPSGVPTSSSAPPTAPAQEPETATAGVTAPIPTPPGG